MKILKTLGFCVVLVAVSMILSCGDSGINLSDPDLRQINPTGLTGATVSAPNDLYSKTAEQKLDDALACETQGNCSSSASSAVSNCTLPAGSYVASGVVMAKGELKMNLQIADGFETILTEDMKKGGSWVRKTIMGPMQMQAKEMYMAVAKVAYCEDAGCAKLLAVVPATSYDKIFNDKDYPPEGDYHMFLYGSSGGETIFTCAPVGSKDKLFYYPILETKYGAGTFDNSKCSTLDDCLPKNIMLPTTTSKINPLVGNPAIYPPIQFAYDVALDRDFNESHTSKPFLFGYILLLDDAGTGAGAGEPAKPDFTADIKAGDDKLASFDTGAATKSVKVLLVKAESVKEDISAKDSIDIKFDESYKFINLELDNWQQGSEWAFKDAKEVANMNPNFVMWQDKHTPVLWKVDITKANPKFANMALLKPAKSQKLAVSFDILGKDGKVLLTKTINLNLSVDEKSAVPQSTNVNLSDTTVSLLMGLKNLSTTTLLKRVTTDNSMRVVNLKGANNANLLSLAQNLAQAKQAAIENGKKAEIANQSLSTTINNLMSDMELPKCKDVGSDAKIQCITDCMKALLSGSNNNNECISKAMGTNFWSNLNYFNSQVKTLDYLKNTKIQSMDSINTAIANLQKSLCDKGKIANNEAGQMVCSGTQGAVAVINSLQNTINSKLADITKQADIIKDAQKSLNDYAALAQNTLDDSMKAVQSQITAATDQVKSIQNQVNSMISSVESSVKTITDKVADAQSTVENAVQQGLSAVQNVEQSVKDAASGALKEAEDEYNNAKTKAETAWNDAKNEVTGLLNVDSWF